MWRELKGKRAIVTGASSGIGRAIAAAFAKAGARVALASRSAEKLQHLALELAGCDTLVAPADVTKPEDRRRLVEAVVEKWGGLDLLSNNAGIGSWGHFATSTESINRQILETNFFAAAELIRVAVPHLAKGDLPAIVNLTSMTARRGMPAWPEYSASKFALIGLTEALRGEMERFGISVLTIVPGLTKTGLNHSLLRNEGRVKIDFAKGMEPAYVAERVLDAVRRNKTEVALGGEAKKILLLNKWAPRLLNRLIAKRVTREYSSLL
jgi:NAD(P)-dependent dehydrogenase (short-subunit alcohol dehydrogenase family)